MEISFPRFCGEAEYQAFYVQDAKTDLQVPGASTRANAGVPLYTSKFCSNAVVQFGRSHALLHHNTMIYIHPDLIE